MVLGHIDVQNEEFCSLDSLAKLLRRIAPQDDIVLLTNILTKGDNLNSDLSVCFTYFRFVIVGEGHDPPVR